MGVPFELLNMNVPGMHNVKIYYHVNILLKIFNIHNEETIEWENVWCEVGNNWRRNYHPCSGFFWPSCCLDERYWSVSGAANKSSSFIHGYYKHVIKEMFKFRGVFLRVNSLCVPLIKWLQTN